MFVFYNSIPYLLDYIEETDGSIIAMIEANRRYIRRCAENILTDFKDVNEQIRLLSSLREMTVTMVESEKKLVHQQVAISEAETAVRGMRVDWANGGAPVDVPTFVEVHAETIQSVMEEQKTDQKKDIDEDPDVRYIDQLIHQQEKLKASVSKEGRSSRPSLSSRSSKRQSDLELLSSHHDLNIIDPVTKKNMTQPVRHTKCGHVYDRASVMHMIKSHGKKGFRCPYMGCACRDNIKERHLEPALDYQHEIDRRNENIARPYNPSKFPS